VSGEVAEAETRLVEHWIRPAVGPDVEVRFAGLTAPSAGAAKTVVLTLLDIAPSLSAHRAAGPAPLQLRARYLVTVAASDPADLRGSLAELGFAAGSAAEVELEATPPSAELWQALGVPARPALIASVLLRRDRGARAAPRVRQPLVTSWSPSRPVAGVVMGPGDVPIAGALVEVEGQPQTTYSNHRGEFAFRAVPGGEPLPTLVVHAKGARVRIRLDAKSSPSDALLIRVPLSEP
jgi:hypothetical protein